MSWYLFGEYCEWLAIIYTPVPSSELTRIPSHSLPHRSSLLEGSQVKSLQLSRTDELQRGDEGRHKRGRRHA